MKRRSLTVLLCLLAIISLASVGFASWVISADDTEFAEGNIQVDTVTDQRIVIEKIEKSEPNFVFGKTKDSTGNAWLNVTNVPNEVMSITFTFTINFKSGGEVAISGNNQNVSVAAVWDDATLAWIETAKTNGYIKGEPALEVVPVTGTDVTPNTFKIVVTFEWGSTFGGVNPMEFYKNHTVDEEIGDTDLTYGDHAAKHLKEMFDFFAVINDANTTYKAFKFTITATPYTPAA